MSNFFHAHAHSRFSVLDSLSPVEGMVEKAKKMRQPAIALTDHGNMSGSIQLYKAGKKHGIQVFPGIEGYLCADPITDSKESGKIKRYHIGILALNFEGYQELTRLSSLSHTRPRFNRFPRFDLSDLAAAKTENWAITTGCFFGLVQQTLVEKGPKAAQRIVEMYARWFPNTFVELQNHNIDHTQQENGSGITEFKTDRDICSALYSIAQRVGLPVVVTQDSHYLDSKEVVAHKLMKRMVYGGEGTENEFPGDSFHLASTGWVQEHHRKKHWKASEEGMKQLLDLHDLEMPALDKYKTHVPSTKKNPQKWLRKECEKALERLAKDGKLHKPKKVYVQRLEHELDIIGYLNQAGYFAMWAEVMEFCQEEKICVEARGSSNGALVCYLLGITQPDPIQQGLLFERFLSKDRKKPPDIDMDIEDVRRDDLVEMMMRRWGVVNIGTYGTLGSREADDKGSVLVTYNSYLRRTMGNDVFIPKFGRGIEQIRDVERYSREDYKGLRLLAKAGALKSYGVHASGLLLNGPDQRIDDYVPTMLVASSNTRVSQFTQDDVEELGNLKNDVLGQRTLTVMRRFQELIGREDPTDFSWVPMDDKMTCKVLSKAQPESGIFQFEGWAMAAGARALKIRSTNDCILAGALFRPACMDSGMTDLYLERRFDKEARESATFPHPAFEEVLKPTYGVVLFQEQVLEIMRRLGMDYDGINTFFKIVKDSGKGATDRNKERAAEVHKTWGDLCKRNGIEDPDEAWHYIEGYTKYGFNKAHATGYGIRSYRIAYFKTHWPLEFMAALLECNAGRAKEPIYVKEARRMGIRLLPPDVNVSGAKWTIDRKKGAIRKGLSSIKGIGDNAAQDIADNAPYSSLEEMFEKCGNRTVSGAPAYKKGGTWSGNLEKLRNAGALQSLGIGRGDE